MADRLPYTEILDYLYRQLPMYQREGASAARYTLDNIRLLCAQLGQPQEKFNSLHVGGTNGKGSVAHLLAALLQAQGYRVGLFTSPHYRDFRERIRINGHFIPKEQVIRFVEEQRDVFEPISPSFFEWSTALAFHYFSQEKVDFAVIEVGLGGRLDSTNILMPLLSVITNIGLDHQQFLGNTLEKIALEKAGIIKPGVPVVIGQTQEETLPVFQETAALREAPVSWADQVWSARRTGSGPDFNTYEVRKAGKTAYPDLRLGLAGDYQQYNLLTVLQALEILKSFYPLPFCNEANIRYALRHVRGLTGMKGRWEIIGRKPLIVCDSAHNAEGLELAMAQLSQTPGQQKHLVIGMVADKDIRSMLARLPKDGKYYFARPDIPRGMRAETLQEAAREFGLKGDPFGSVTLALRAAKRNAGPEDVIYIGGSTFVVAEVI